MKFFDPRFSKAQKRRFLKQAEKIINRGDFINGQEIRLLEKELSSYFKQNFVSCNSGTDAIRIGLEALGIGSGDEVITSAFTYFATIDAICRVGAKPVLVDIDRQTYNIDPKAIERKITKKTKAVLAVHLFGLACDMEPIQRICQRHRIKLIEDNAQSFGARYKRKLTGTLGDIGCFSFFPTKNLACFGDGGGITTGHPKVAQKFRMLKNHGQKSKNNHIYMGDNSRLDTLQAGFLLERLNDLPKEISRRQKQAKKWVRELKNNSEVLNLPTQEGHTYNQFSLLVKNRNKFVAQLEKKRTPYMIYYDKPVYKQPAFKKHYGQHKTLPNSEFVSKHIISLPIFN